MTRHERRKASLARKRAKDAAIVEAFLGQQRDAIVRRNLASKPERNFYPQSIWASFEGQTHRASEASNLKRPSREGGDRVRTTL